ncbi:MAG: membrane protein insertase YidC [Thermodesulfobacteriota bacterium]
MEKRAVLAFVLSMIVFIAWSYFFSSSPPKTERQAEKKPLETAKVQDKGQVAIEAETPAKSQTAPDAAPAKTGPGETLTADKAREVVVTTDLYTAVFTESGGRLKHMQLHKYQETAEPDSPPKDLVLVSSKADLPLGLHFQSGHAPNLTQAPFRADRTAINVKAEGGKAALTLTYHDPGGLTVERVYSFDDNSYLLGLKINLRNLSPNEIDDNLILSLASNPLTAKETYAGFGAWLDDELLEYKPSELEEKLEALKTKTYKLTWAAYEDQYFLAAVLPAEKEKTRLKAEKYGDRGVKLGFICPPLVMNPRTEKSYQFEVYYGPKDYNILKSLENGLERSIYFGWVDILSKPLLILMTWLYRYVGNYGLVILIVTVLIKILFWPLTAKSYKSMKGMQKLQPKIVKLREKYKDDREAMNREMMQLYKTYKVNPLGGCLPMAIQIPVFIALYRLLDYSLELRHAPFWLWIKDLSAPDRLWHFGFHVPFMDDPAGIPVLTLFMGVSMLIQQKLSPSPGDPTQAKIMMMLPIFFTVIFINFPSGLVLYWLVNNILSIGQQILINKRPT